LRGIDTAEKIRKGGRQLAWHVHATPPTPGRLFEKKLHDESI